MHNPYINLSVRQWIAIVFIGGFFTVASLPLFSQNNTAAPAAPAAAGTTPADQAATPETPAPAPEPAAPAPPKADVGLWDLFEKGGWTMYPLALSSFVALGIIFERIYFLYTAKLLPKGFNIDLAEKMEKGGLEAAKEFIAANPEYKISDVLKNGLEVSAGDAEIFAKGIEREAAEVITVLERGLVIIAAVSTIAPLIGFLGTVSGMINAFDAIANADQVNAKVVAGGIKEALITTAAGLIIAIPAMTFHQYLTSRIDGFTSEVEEAANRIYKEFLKQNARA
ncbi:MotA/TolQ/ExbB proton channel family protein [Leptospira langatensis]|uniref:MotA/TolQ/ExbB proton channel family protein n=1 Tax=Leptospira langatensis TaxID=2484983 RepID=A0A5F1ZNR0_9LEPT|nr:MotA/TolQ/ExbB proton channel family protein [Leptospira langatensis]TGK05134.1 MotA/TolQ/ExbB proton channel family protein [Leptospira langatensis]TGL38271.1 MotA/TolQ/ExbB proton channel family protein [Leptospira langatensis]